MNYCNAAVWKNTSWRGGNVPGLSLKNRPINDTLIIPTRGYAVLRIRSDNSGKLFMFCHIEFHTRDGMAMVLKEAMENVPKTPMGLPVYKNFYNDHSKDVAGSNVNVRSLLFSLQIELGCLMQLKIKIIVSLYHLEAGQQI